MWLKESNYKLKLFNQILLFINVYTSIGWFASSCYVLYTKTADFELLSLNFPLICFCIGFPVEALRLYLGYSGNIRNDVSLNDNRVYFFGNRVGELTIF